MSARTPASDLPDVGAWLPGWCAVAVVAVVGLVLSVTTLDGWWFLGVVLTGAAVAVPRSMCAWVLAGVLAFGHVDQPLGLAGWPSLALLVAAVHVLHLAGAWSLALPVGGRVSLAVLRPTLVRFVAVQLAAQGVTLGVLAVADAAGRRGPSAAATFAGAAAAVLLLVGSLWLRRRGLDAVTAQPQDETQPPLRRAG